MRVMQAILAASCVGLSVFYALTGSVGYAAYFGGVAAFSVLLIVIGGRR